MNSAIKPIFNALKLSIHFQWSKSRAVDQFVFTDTNAIEHTTLLYTTAGFKSCLHMFCQLVGSTLIPDWWASHESVRVYYRCIRCRLYSAYTSVQISHTRVNIIITVVSHRKVGIIGQLSAVPKAVVDNTLRAHRHNTCHLQLRTVHTVWWVPICHYGYHATPPGYIHTLVIQSPGPGIMCLQVPKETNKVLT